MKKLLITITLTIAFVINIQAQADKQKSFILGLSFSPSIDFLTSSSISPNEYKTDGSIIGYAYGLSIDFGIGNSPNYFLSTGLQIKRSGGKLLYNDSLEVSNGIFKKTDISRKYKVDYIRIPLALKLKTNQFGRYTVYGLFGLDNNICINAKAEDLYKLQGAGGSDLPSDNIEVGDNIAFMRVGLYVGLGAEYTINGSTKAFAGLHYSNGFTDILTGKNSLTLEKESAKNRYFELTFGVLF